MSDRASKIDANLFDDDETVINPATEDKQDDIITELEKKADLTETQPVSAVSLPLPAGASTSAKQLADGHNVTANAGTNLNTSALATEATMTADLQSIEDNQTDKSQMTQITNGTIESNVVAAADDSTDLEDANGLVTNSILNGRISNTAIRPLRIDSSTHVIKTINYEHSEVHDGNSFSVSDTVAADTTTVKWQITTPNSTTYAHLLFELTCTGEATFLVTEGSDRVDGTALQEINRKRVGTPAAATIIVTRTPTGGTTDGATTLFSRRSGSTGVASKTIETGSARGTTEWILKPNTKYVVSITTYADVFASLLLDWYEHQDKN